MDKQELAKAVVEILAQRAEDQEEKSSKEGAVAREGERITVPITITLDEAVKTIQRQQKYEEEKMQILEAIPGCFWDGAHAFFKAMKLEFGWVHGEVDHKWFGDVKPQMRSISSGVKSTVLVPWGKFSVPGIDGVIATSYAFKDGHFVFQINAEVKRKHETRIRHLAERARELVASESLYRGKAVRMRFKNDAGEPIPMPEPKFMDVRHLSRDTLILPDHVSAAVDTSILTPIEKSAECRRYGVPLKRGVLMSGVFGTGKTLAAYVTAHSCEDHGWTFIYGERADELADCVRFAHSYQPAVVFNEDIDRVLSGERDISMDEVLNIIDGIEAKGTEIMVVLTTNEVSRINRAMLRPGRLDAMIEFEKPDAAAAAALVKLYGRGLIEEDADLAPVGKALAGMIPSAIRECVERAKLSQIKLGLPDGFGLVLTADALLDAANGMRAQLALLAGDAVVTKSTQEKLGQVLHDLVESATEKAALKAING